MSSLLFLNTRERDEGSHNDATWYLPDGELRGSYVLTFVGAEFIMAQYPIASSRFNDVIYFQEINAGQVINQAILQADRTYTADEFAAEIALQMTGASDNGWTYTVNYATTTFKLTVSANAANEFRIVTGPSTAHNEMGMDTNDTSFNNSLEMAGPVELSGTNFVRVISNLGGTGNHASDGRKPIAHIPVESNFGHVIVFHAPVPVELTGTEGQSLRLQLLDDRGNAFQMPENAPISYTFSIREITD